MGLKGNQGTALNEVQSLFKRVRDNDSRELPFTHHEITEVREHGRSEVRRMWVPQDVKSFFEYQNWKGLGSFIIVERERTVNSQTSFERTNLEFEAGTALRTLLCCERCHEPCEERAKQQTRDPGEEKTSRLG